MATVRGVPAWFLFSDDECHRFMTGGQDTNDKSLVPIIKLDFCKVRLTPSWHQFLSTAWQISRAAWLKTRQDAKWFFNILHPLWKKNIKNLEIVCSSSTTSIMMDECFCNLPNHILPVMFGKCVAWKLEQFVISQSHCLPSWNFSSSLKAAAAASDIQIVPSFVYVARYWKDSASQGWLYKNEFQLLPLDMIGMIIEIGGFLHAKKSHWLFLPWRLDHYNQHWKCSFMIKF